MFLIRIQSLFVHLGFVQDFLIGEIFYLFEDEFSNIKVYDDVNKIHYLMLHSMLVDVLTLVG